MDFHTPPRRAAQEPMAPMINVVFLLLIFFMLAARMAPPDPYETTPPEATGGLPEGRVELFLSPEGEFAFGDARGEAALSAIGEARAAAPVLLRADGGMEAAILARALKALAEAGLDPVELVTLPRRDGEE